MDKIYDCEMAEQRVLILTEARKEKTASGIYIPESADDDKPKIGTILRTGTGSKDNPMNYVPGDIVLLSKFAGVEIEMNFTKLGKKTFVVTNQLDIMMKLKEVNE